MTGMRLLEEQYKSGATESAAYLRLRPLVNQVSSGQTQIGRDNALVVAARTIYRGIQFVARRGATSPDGGLNHGFLCVLCKQGLF